MTGLARLSLPHGRRSIARRAAAAAVVLLVSSGANLARAVTPPCPGGWFHAQAMVTQVLPPTAKVNKRTGSGGAPSPLKAGSVLCQGESLVFEEPGDGSEVELYENDKVVRVSAQTRSYTVQGGVQGVLEAAGSYLNSVMSGVPSLSAPPSRSKPTGARGSGDAPQDPASVRRVLPILPLRDLPPQRVTRDTGLVVGWVNGVGPYACEALDQDGALLWSRKDIAQAWCEVPPGIDHVARVLVREHAGRSNGWNVQLANDRDIPRPPWLPPGPPAGAERTAWAIWLWQEGGPQWRLQALGMLNALSASQFIAGYFVDTVLAEVPLVQPR